MTPAGLARTILPTLTRDRLVTYYPPPYQPPQGPLGFGPYSPGGDVLAPARRARIAMFIIAGLLLFCGGGILFAAFAVDWDVMMQKSEQVYGPELTSQMRAQGATPQTAQAEAIVFGAVGLALAVALGTLAFFVGRGSIGAIITAIVVTSLMVIANVCPVVLMLFTIPRFGAAGAIGGCIFVIPLLISCVLLLFLIAAARAAARRKQALQQEQSYHLYMQQQRAQYGEAGQGYGYGTAPPPGSPPAGPPPEAQPPGQPPSFGAGTDA